jgi:hypothetical protein
MIDWAAVTGFDWDAGNARKSVDKHDVSQAEAEQIFFNEPLLRLHDQPHSGQELRFHAVGRTEEGRLLHITFTMRDAGRLIHVISARDVHRKELPGSLTPTWTAYRCAETRPEELCAMITL